MSGPFSKSVLFVLCGCLVVYVHYIATDESNRQTRNIICEDMGWYSSSTKFDPTDSTEEGVENSSVPKMLDDFSQQQTKEKVQSVIEIRPEDLSVAVFLYFLFY